MFHLVDPDSDVLSVTSEILVSAGFETLTFDSPVTYLEYVNSAAFVPAIAILTCFIMPDMDGYALVRAVREKQPHQRAMIISGSPTNDIPPDEENLVCLHLCKPYEAETLIAALNTLNLCDDACTMKWRNDKFKSRCQFGLQHACPFFTAA